MRDNEELFISFHEGVADLTAFAFDYKEHSDGDYFTVSSAAGDYTTPPGVVLGA